MAKATLRFVPKTSTPKTGVKATVTFTPKPAYRPKSIKRVA